MRYLNWHHGVPTYGYDLGTGGKRRLSGRLCFCRVKAINSLSSGIVYDELSEEDKEVYEQTFDR